VSLFLLQKSSFVEVLGDVLAVKQVLKLLLGVGERQLCNKAFISSSSRDEVNWIEEGLVWSSVWCLLGDCTRELWSTWWVHRVKKSAPTISEAGLQNQLVLEVLKPNASENPQIAPVAPNTSNTSLGKWLRTNINKSGLSFAAASALSLMWSNIMVKGDFRCCFRQEVLDPSVAARVETAISGWANYSVRTLFGCKWIRLAQTQVFWVYCFNIRYTVVIQESGEDVEKID